MFLSNDPAGLPGDIDFSLTRTAPEAPGSSKWIKTRWDWLWRKRERPVEEETRMR